MVVSFPFIYIWYRWADTQEQSVNVYKYLPDKMASKHSYKVSVQVSRDLTVPVSAFRNVYY